MSSHVGYVVKVEKLRPHTNADRLLIATFFGNDTCVSLDVHEGDIGIYFPTDLQLSEEFCIQNHLLRKLPDGTPDTGYMDASKRNVTAIKLRGEKSDGLYVGISALAYTGVDLDSLTVGTTIDVVNGHEICKKYIPRRNVRQSSGGKGNKTRKVKVPIAPLFMEHADTEQLAYSLGDFKEGDLIEITLKMHGTSQRTGYLPVLKGYKRSLLDRIMRREGKPIYEWGYVSGTRRTVLDGYDGGFYGSNEFRKTYADFFEGKLHKGEEVFYEIVSYLPNGTPIMGVANNKKTQDKDFIKTYGAETVFSYGCEVGESDFYVYRMTMTNEDGDVVEYDPDFMRYRCEQMGCKTVPVFERMVLPSGFMGSNTPGDYAMWLAEQYYDGPDPIGKTHIREGVVVRIVNRPKFTAYKLKNFSFKCLEGLIKAEASAPDMEEAEEIKGEEDGN